MGKKDPAMVREVSLRLRRGRKRKLLADVHMDLHAGDVGVVETLGRRMATFQRILHVNADSA